MGTIAQDFAAAAASMIGTPFRLHGREPGRALDCVGVVSAALQRVGRPHRVPLGYRLRNTDPHAFIPIIEEAGFLRTSGPAMAGDLVLAKPGPGQLHLLIATSAQTYVHAHAGLDRVVETPAPLDWPLLGSWRLNPD